MSDLFELVFEGVKTEDISNCIEIVTGYSVSSNGKWSDFLSRRDDELFSVVLDQAVVFGLQLSVVALRVLRYSGVYDVELNWENQEAVLDSGLADLKSRSNIVRRQLRISACYCGMEPAHDEDTQFFFNEKSGPLAGPD